MGSLAVFLDGSNFASQLEPTICDPSLASAMKNFPILADHEKVSEGGIPFPGDSEIVHAVL